MPHFQMAKTTRRGSPRATRPEARAKLVHTSNGGRQIVAYITAPLLAQTNWREGGRVAASWAIGEEALLLRLTPSHAGPSVRPHGPKTTTKVITISGDFIAPSACAPVRPVPFERDGDALVLRLPASWARQQREARNAP